MVADIYTGDGNVDIADGSYLRMYGYGAGDTLGSNAIAVGFVKIYGGNGADNLYYYGDGTAKLAGGKGGDWLYGGIHDDKLIGGKGGDWLFGGLGNDWLKGGKGPDHFGFNTIPDSKTNVDMIVDFEPKKDLLHFNSFVYTSGFDGTFGVIARANFNKGKGAEDSDDYFGYNPKNGKVWYDLNGNDPGGKETVAILEESLHIKYSHFHFD
ncbi:calcium-binding protein [Bauldia litoralis]|uniref:calcium-binding protein n=1 Tax=Bauldia litoralis TaxID=665467 RepID=UPI003264BC6F